MSLKRVAALEKEAPHSYSVQEIAKKYRELHGRWKAQRNQVRALRAMLRNTVERAVEQERLLRAASVR